MSETVGLRAMETTCKWFTMAREWWRCESRAAQPYGDAKETASSRPQLFGWPLSNIASSRPRSNLRSRN